MTRRGVMGATAGLGVLSWGGLGRAGDDGGSIAARMDAAVERAVVDADFSGALMLKRGDQVVYQRAVGQAERVFGAANGIDTRFNVASIGKMFTATAILRLVEQRRVDLDTPVLRYLPDYPPPPSPGRSRRDNCCRTAPASATTGRRSPKSRPRPSSRPATSCL